MFTNSDITKLITDYLKIDELYKFGQSGICKIDYINLDTVIEFIKKYPKIRYMPHIVYENKNCGNIDDIKLLNPKNQIKILEQIKPIINKSNIQNILHEACIHNYLNVIQYLHQELNMTKKNIQSNNNEAISLASGFNNINVIKYLHENFNLTREDICDKKNNAILRASTNGNLEIVKYLCEKVNLTKEDIRGENINVACRNGHINICDYLKKIIDNK